MVRAHGGSGPPDDGTGDADMVADISEELHGGNGVFVASGRETVMPAGFVEHEFAAAGTATDYRAVGALDPDGHWRFEPDTQAPYRTRVVVRRPHDVARASGTVLVEWLNVSGGLDASPDYASLEDEIVREGHTWIGVSAQLIGVEGGPTLVNAPGAARLAGRGLKALDPERYASLAHPGDGFAFDIYTQVARAARQGGAFLGGLDADLVLAVGESQSALALTTYYNGVHPLAAAFDGFLVHSRAAVSLPLVARGEYADFVGSFLSGTHALLRTDLRTPILELQAEGDVIGVLNSIVVRQPDTDCFRLWEVAGTAHADVHLVGEMADKLDCGAPINNGPMHVVAKAALRALVQWVRAGLAPASAPRLELTDGAVPEIRRDADGIARGGVRTPPLDVPVDVLSGAPGPKPSPLCILLGSTVPIRDARLAEMYSSREEYDRRYTAAVDAAIDAGFVLEDDRAALEAFAQPSRIPSP
ncbi:MAG: hypothetical protein IT198_15030 [Acidimicrobiia bacterium]|nr:hypothetical protein [Acidimicrobiia bacterium]